MACTPPCWFAITLYLQSVALMIPLIGWASFQIASIFGGYILGVLALQIRVCLNFENRHRQHKL
jgi:hypothetical protein